MPWQGHTGKSVLWATLTLATVRLLRRYKDQAQKPGKCDTMQRGVIIVGPLYAGENCIAPDCIMTSVGQAPAS
jgi:hypothetical protein